MAHEYVKTFGIPYTLQMRHFWNSRRYQAWVVKTGDNRRNPIYQKIKKICRPVIERYQNEENLPVPQSYYDNPKNVWFLWWQGADDLPEIIDACYRRMQKCIPPAWGQVQLITKDNYRDFFSIDEEVLGKLQKGMIPVDMSNIVRHSLLSEHGGIWLDSNYFARGVLPEAWFTCDGVYTERKEGLRMPPHFGNWSSSFIACPPGTVATRFTRDALIYYWKHYDIKIDYTLHAQLLSIAYDSFAPVRNDLAKVPVTPYAIHHNTNLPEVINEAYDKIKFDEIFQRRPIHKITHKETYRKVTEDGRPTMYAHILELADQVPEQ